VLTRALSHGGKVTQIRAYYKNGKNQLKLVYEDNGVGIPKPEKKKIFKEGYGKGTGYVTIPNTENLRILRLDHPKKQANQKKEHNSQ
jgi:anti-sigma regulatory factor (Ser/Thr protein kinase)